MKKEKESKISSSDLLPSPATGRDDKAGAKMDRLARYLDRRCPRCGGLKYVSDYWVPYMYECPECKGTGERLRDEGAGLGNAKA
jgi:uncharacterized protein (DUF983 family)